MEQATEQVTEQGQPTLAAFRQLVRERGAELYRDLPWRRTRDPYAIWVSEVMLQQTQVARVDGRWQRWLERFPTVEVLATATPADVLEEWQGMGYNRRALALRTAAQAIVARDGAVPSDVDALVALPGIGPATAAGIRAFAFDLPGVYLETNVRAVFLHELFPGAEHVPDRELVPLVEACCPAAPNDAECSGDARAAGQASLAGEAAAPASGVTSSPAARATSSAARPVCPDASYAIPVDPADTPRSWYYALLDYGAWLKSAYPNPSRRSAAHVRQSRFEGSRRQKRAELVRILLSHRNGVDFAALVEELASQEDKAGRMAPSDALVAELLGELSGEGFCHEEAGLWRV